VLEVPRELMWRAQAAFPNAVVRAPARDGAAQAGATSAALT
jgi:hypothetical protein